MVWLCSVLRLGRPSVVSAEDAAEETAHADAAAMAVAVAVRLLVVNRPTAVGRDVSAAEASARAIRGEANDLLQLARVQRHGTAATTGVQLDPGGVDVLRHLLAVLAAPDGGTGLHAVLQTVHRFSAFLVRFCALCMHLTGKAV